MEMTTHDRTIQLITVLDYNARQIAQVLGISTRGASYKLSREKGNQFTESDLEKFKNFIENLNKTAQQ